MQQSYFHISFRPSIKLISTVRRFTEQFYDQTLDDRDMSERVALATHELLENAVAYAVDSEAAVRVEIAADYIVITTWNKTNPERVAELIAMIETINAAADPDGHYQAMMRKAAYRTDGSGLGLARIRAEAGMAITCELDGDRIRISARADHRVARRAEAAAP